MMKNVASTPRYRHWRRPNEDQSGVSEAIGTIILLAIAISLIGIVAIWVETVPEVPEHKKVDLFFEHGDLVSGQMTIDIEHQGGDLLYSEEIEIRIIIFPTFNNLYLGFSDSNNTDLIDNVWDVGDHWSYTLTGLPENAEVEIKVIDFSGDGDKTLFRKELSLGRLGPDLPDLEISPDNLILTYDGDFIRKDRLVRITATVYNLGNLNATGIVRFFDDNRLIISGGREYTKVDVPYKYTPTADNFQEITINWIPARWGIHNLNVKIYSFEYETNYANNFATKNVEVEFYFEPPEGPDLSVTEFDINPSNAYPMHGNDLNISIIIHNLGDIPIPSTEIFNVSVSLGNETMEKQITTGLRARDSMELFAVFIEIGPGGITEITVELDTENIITEVSENNNIAIREIQILPTILIVDDDSSESGKKDVADTLMKALKGRGVTFDYYNTKGASDSNPRYDAGPRKLSNFDIVIWVTGYETENTITSVNMDNLKVWLNEPDTINSLWVIGQDVLNDTVAVPGVVDQADFAYQYLGIQGYQWNGTPEFLYGTPGDVITDGMVLNTSDYLPNQDRGLNLTHRPSDINSRIYSILGNQNLTGLDPANAIRYYNVSNSYRVVYFGFELSSISSPFDLSNVTYHVLRWFNYSLEEGYDFGVVDQQFSTLSPQFMDVITISATVVNNGPDEEDVAVLFYVTDPAGGITELESYPDLIENPQMVSIPGKGGRRIVSKQWLATSVGEHNFRVMVDPFDQYQEIVEENNDFSYYGLEVTKLRIQYTILLVDDDNSTNNGGPYSDVVTPVKKALDDLGYYYVEHVVIGGPIPEDGPDVDVLKHYNTVIWLTGNDIGPTLSAVDQQNLEDYLYGNYVESKYLTIKVNLLLVGQNILDDINGSGDNVVPDPGFFVNEYLNVKEYSTNKPLGTSITGIADNPITHGSFYPLEKDFADETDILITEKGNNYLFWQNKLLNEYNSVYNEHWHNHSRIAFLAWELSFVKHTGYPAGLGYEPSESHLNELVYLILNWFEYPKTSAELRIVDIDISISEDKPNLGESYLISTYIYNHGSVDCSTILRYYDGETIIDTDTIFVPGDGIGASEIIWVPHYAGNRTIHIFVDTENDVPEVFETLNNNASVPNTLVYFFYDDMESGISNWNHDSTILRISGESSLEYMDKPIFTSINSTWAEVSKFEQNFSAFYTANSCFYAEEPVGVTRQADVLLALVIDDSRSMQERKDSQNNTWLSVAKNASKYLVSQLSDESKVCIWHFRGNNEERALAFTLLDGTGRTTVYNAIDSMDNPAGQTILWDAVGEAYNDVKNAIPGNETLEPAVVVLSDGADYQSSDTSAVQIQKIEAASDKWAPWGNLSDGEQSYTRHRGKYSLPFDTIPGVWYTAGGGSFDGSRYGLLYCDVKIYTIGLGLEHHEPPYLPSTPTYPGNGNSDDNATNLADVESGTVEYNLWRISTSSGAKYFYSPTTDELQDIFGQIAQMLGGILTRGSRASDIGKDTSYAVTENFSLQNVTSAKLSFYHKYSLSEGYNGAIVRVGIPNGTNIWSYKYIQPMKLYNGNLNLRRREFDDFGSQMLWCWNGVSVNGLFDWEYAEFDLTPFIGMTNLRLNFTLVLYGGGTGGGWWVDDVEVKVTREDQETVTNSTRDQWKLTSLDSYSGDYCWWNVNPTTGNLKGGIDNSLYTRQIDMTNARNATLSAYFKFNINSAAGRPPDGFRVEISKDNGVSWTAINLGVRSSWGLSGNDSDASDGIPNDGKSYTGINLGNYWVEAGSLTRLNCDLSGWAGEVISLRFRVVTASDLNPFFGSTHYDSATVGFGGFYIDDVVIHGFSLQE